jgi:proteasome lid subunit RPN8/RPN11
MIPVELIEQLKWAACTDRREICGLISDDLKIHFIKNVAASKDDFVFDRVSYFQLMNRLRTEGQTVKCIFHSHLTGTPDASKEDLNCYRRLGFDMLIVTASDYRYYEKGK